MQEEVLERHVFQMEMKRFERDKSVMEWVEEERRSYREKKVGKTGKQTHGEREKERATEQSYMQLD